MKMTKRQTKVLLATIFCANILNSTVLASPADEAKMFAEQFKKPIKIENNIETNNIKTNKTAEEILSDSNRFTDRSRRRLGYGTISRKP